MRRMMLLFLSLVLLTGCAPFEPQDLLVSPAPTEIVTSPPAATPTELTPSPTAAEAEPTLELSPTVGEPTTTPEPSPTAEPEPLRIAYTGLDGNLWLVDPATGVQEPLTQDAARPSPDSQVETIQYCCAQWTTDRSLLGYRRDVGTPFEEGMSYRFELWVYDTLNQEHRLALEDQLLAGFAWKPLTHLLVYSLQVEGKYFTSAGVSADLARGIWAVDANGGEPFELAPPAGGHWLANPEWSRDGRFLSFEEVLYLEGRGNFAYYDFEAQEYVAWERPIGNYDWSPDAQAIIYDDLLYIPTGAERIYASDRFGEGERAISPPMESGYAFDPVFSPEGNRIAYLAEEGGPASSRYNVYVQPYPDGDPESLGVFEQVTDLAWMPDGSGLVFSSGPFESQQVLLAAYPSGEVTTLADGYQPRLPPLLP